MDSKGSQGAASLLVDEVDARLRRVAERSSLGSNAASRWLAREHRRSTHI